jgi:hypothetical protein
VKDYLLAALLLSTSPDVVETRVPTAGEWVVLQKSLVAVAIEWQIMDEREALYTFARPEDYAGDLGSLRRRYQQLKDAPLVEDSHRFPERAGVNELLRFNRAFRKNVEGRMGLESDRTALYTQVIAETDRLYKVWDLARDGRCEYYYVQVRRQALMQLRDMLGEDDYRNAVLPPNVPTWRFNDVR